MVGSWLNCKADFCYEKFMMMIAPSYLLPSLLVTLRFRLKINLITFLEFNFLAIVNAAQVH